MKSLLKFIAAGLLACVVASQSAQAVPVTLNSITYDVVAYTPGAGLNDVAVFAILTDQPWYGNSSLAYSAAAQVNSQLGAFYFLAAGWGPFFVYNPGSGAFWQGDMNQASYVGFSTSYDGFTFAIVNTAATTPDTGASAALLGIGLVGLAALRRKFSRA